MKFAGHPIEFRVFEESLVTPLVWTQETSFPSTVVCAFDSHSCDPDLNPGWKLPVKSKMITLSGHHRITSGSLYLNIIDETFSY